MSTLAPSTSGSEARLTGPLDEELVVPQPPRTSPQAPSAATNAGLTVRGHMGSSARVSELPPWARRLIEDVRVARLGLLDDGGAPRVLPVTFAVCGASLVSAVDDKPKRVPGARMARVRWLRADPRAALTVDRYDDDWSALAWVQALGTVEVLEAADAPAALSALVRRYPQYREQPPGGPLLVLEPERLLWWRP